MGPAVFISYARATNTYNARALRQALKKTGIDAFLDTKELQPGERLPEKLVDALLGARQVVILVDETYFKRWYCLWELKTALAPFLALGPGALDEEKERALAPLLIALPQSEHPSELERLPPGLNSILWVQASQRKRLVQLVRERLEANASTLGECVDRAGGSQARLRKQLREDTALYPPLNLANVSRVYPLNLLPSLSEAFVGRMDDLWRIDFALNTLQGQATGAALSGALLGSGGAGKTRLALEYVHRFGPRYYPGGIFWVTADVSDEELERQLYEILRTLQPDIPALSVLHDKGQKVAQELARKLHAEAAKEPILYVVDNVPEAPPHTERKPLEDWCPALGKVALLVTTRDKGSLRKEDGLKALPVDMLTPAAAVELLTRELPLPGLDDDSWREIAEWVEHLPLALELLNAALTDRVLTPAELLASARREGQQAQILDAQEHTLRKIGSAGRLRGARKAYLMSYRRLPVPARRVARLIAWLGPEPLPLELFNALGEEARARTVRPLLLLRHFVRQTSEGEAPVFCSMHRVLADFLRGQSRKPAEDLRQVCSALVEVMKQESCLDPKEWPRMNALLPHAERVFRRLNAMALKAGIEDEVRLGIRIGNLLEARGLASQAQEFQRTAYERAREILGSQHPATLSAMNSLALTLQSKGELAAARKLQQEVLETRLRVLGKEHPDTLTAMHNLVSTLLSLGELTAARKLQEEVLKARLRVQGKKHSDTLTAMHNLASMLLSQGELAAARKLQVEVLKARLQVMGKEHPDTLTTMHNLALTLHSQGELATARKLQEEVLKTRLRVLGKDHPATLAAMLSLASSLQSHGELAAALRHREEVLKASLQVLGEDHPATLAAMHGLASSLLSHGELAAARKLQVEVLETRLRVLGKEHSQTTSSAFLLLQILLEQRDLMAARDVLVHNLIWLMAQNPESLTNTQRFVRSQLAVLTNREARPETLGDHAE